MESVGPLRSDPFAGSSRSLNRNGSPSSIDDPTFWVPPTCQKQSSLLGDVQSSAGRISEKTFQTTNFLLLFSITRRINPTNTVITYKQ